MHQTPNAPNAAPPPRRALRRYLEELAQARARLIEATRNMRDSLAA